MASSAVSAYNSGSAPGSRENAASQNLAERTTIRSASPFVRAYKDEGASNSAQNQEKSATYTSFPDAKGVSEQRGDAEASTSPYGAKRSTYDFHAVLRKYNIRLDEVPSEPPKANGQTRLDDKPKQNAPPSTSQAQSASAQQAPQSDASSRWTLRNSSQTANNVSSVSSTQNVYDYSTTAKYETGKSDYLRRGNDEPSQSTYAFETGLENRVANRAYQTVDTTQRPTQPPAATIVTPAYAMPNSLSNSSISYVNGKYEAPATTTAPVTHSDSANIIALRRQLAERDAECTALRRQLEDERERLRRSQAALAAATSAAASAAAAAAQPDPTTAARLIELETMRERYEELLAEKTSLEETVDRLRTELDGTGSRSPAQAHYSLARRYAHENYVRNDAEDENYGAVGSLLASQRRTRSVESRPRDLHVAECATYAVPRIERDGDFRLLRNSQSDDADASGDWRNEAQTLRERNRMMTDENTQLRAQLLAAKRPAPAPTVPSSVEVETMRYYETQVADAREMVRKLQTQANYAAPRTEANSGLPPRAPRMNESLSSAESQARRADAYVWRSAQDYARSPSPTRAVVDHNSIGTASRTPLDLHASARSPTPGRFVADAAYANGSSDYAYPAPAPAAYNAPPSVASVTANITRLLDRSNAAVMQSRSVAPVKVTAPPTLVAGAGAGAAQPALAPATGFAYRQLMEDNASRKSRLSSSETQLGAGIGSASGSGSAYFGASKYALQNGAAQPQSYPVPSAERRTLTGFGAGAGAGAGAGPGSATGVVTGSTRTIDYQSSRPYTALRLSNNLR